MRLDVWEKVYFEEKETGRCRSQTHENSMKLMLVIEYVLRMNWIGIWKEPAEWNEKVETISCWIQLILNYCSWT